MRHRERWSAIKQDLWYGVRLLKRSPVFAGAAILTLAVGIGATTAVFSAADHVLLRPLPYADVERIVTLKERVEGDESLRPVSPANLLSWAERSLHFDDMGLAEPSGVSLGDTSPPVSVSAWAVSKGFLRALGVVPVAGRLFEEDEYVQGGPASILISEEFWEQRYARASDAVGSPIRVDGGSAVIVGVLPAGMEYPGQKSIWLPKHFRRHELVDRSSAYMEGVARLKKGSTIGEARADVERVSSALAQEFPSTNADLSVHLTPLRQHVFGPVRPAILALLGAVGFVLSIACVNVASLLLARGAEREREFGLRAALGATRVRLLSQLITESVLLAVLGGIGGVLLAHVGVDLLVAMSPPDLPRMDQVRVDGRVMLFASGITLIVAFLFGLVPALRFSRPDLRGSLGSGIRSGPIGMGRSRLRSVLVTAEIALALVLLVGTGLLLRSFVGLVRTDPGFVSEKRVSMQMFIHRGAQTPSERIAKGEGLAERFRALSGVEEVAIVTALPFHPSRIDAQDQMTIEGRPHPGSARVPHVYTTVASPEYFGTMGIPIRAGRAFTEHDRLQSPAVAIINETFVSRFFKGENPIGQRVTVGVLGSPRTWEIVGVVADVRPTALDSSAEPEVFVPFAQSGSGSLTFVARTSVDAASVIPAMRRAVAEAYPDQAIYHTATMRALVSETLAEREFHLALFAFFSGIALVLTIIGVYGLIRFSVSQRRSEIGLRVAIGAGGSQISRLIVGEALKLTCIGVTVGVLFALWLTRFMESMLVETPPQDAWTFGVIILLMLVVSTLAAAIPARQAARIDPMMVLRHE